MMQRMNGSVHFLFIYPATDHLAATISDFAVMRAQVQRRGLHVAPRRSNKHSKIVPEFSIFMTMQIVITLRAKMRAAGVGGAILHYF